AVTLLALNRIHRFPLDGRRLESLGAALGSDVPFFLKGGTALGLGRGEIVRPLRDLDPCPVLLMVPGLAISPPEAFSRAGDILTPHRGQTSIYRFARQRVREPRGFRPAPNDLQSAVSTIHPGLGRLLRLVRSQGATVAAMTGSGSAVFGLFAGERQA